MDKWINNFDFTPITINNEEYIIKKEDILALESELSYYHSKGDPSTWLVGQIYNFIDFKYKTKPESIRKEIAAHLLGITVQKFESSLEWNRNYMAWHG